MDLNDLIEEVEENIPQQQVQQQDPVPVEQNLMQVDGKNIPFVEGFPIPPLNDLIGE